MSRICVLIVPMGVRRGNLDEAVHHGISAFQFDRKTEASLLSRAADLDHMLEQRYPSERLTRSFRERYSDTRRALHGRTQTER